ncbi:MAG: hypothetical protein CMM98_01175 [Rickettsiales bacterium]|nr:hypothetical protein [Rickettsiales bacterium]|tara:strand:- start:436 stop:807 length:372 start_codon:yes stop_codon:yes gene_type:complete
MRFQKKNNFNYFKVILFTWIFILLGGCEDLFLRFKYETYECTKNYFKLKNVFIKNYELGDLVDVEIDNNGYKLEIKENNEDFMIIERDDPLISIRIEKKLSELKVNFKNHIQNIKCSKHVFKM